MQPLTVAAILLAVASILLSQLPYSDANPLIPVTAPDFGGYTATRIVPYWHGVPFVWFAQLGLIIVWIEMRIRLDIEKEKQECRLEK